MMKKVFLCFILISFTTFLNAQELTAYFVEARILTLADSRRQLINWAEQNNGFFLRDSTTYLVLRVPNNMVQNLKQVLEEKSLKVLQFNIRTRSLDQERNMVSAAIISREEILQQTMDYIHKANLEGTLAIEREIAGIINEIEYNKGRLRVIDNNALFADIQINLVATKPVGPSSENSSFSWLETMDFYNFVGKRF